MVDTQTRGLQLLDAAQKEGIVCRTLGGVAVRIVCPRVTATGTLHRELNDIDFVTLKRDAHDLEVLFARLGLIPAERFNLLHGDKRLLFVDPETEKHIDIFVDTFEMCHRIDLRKRLSSLPLTLAVSDLLLTKLQIAQINEKDVKDVAALCLENAEPLSVSWFDPDYLAGVAGSDWGWWKTLSDNVGVTYDAVGDIGLDQRNRDKARDVLNELKELLEDCPKSTKWKLRGRLGARVPWREEPEEPQR